MHMFILPRSQFLHVFYIRISLCCAFIHPPIIRLTTWKTFPFPIGIILQFYLMWTIPFIMCLFRITVFFWWLISFWYCIFNTAWSFINYLSICMPTPHFSKPFLLCPPSLNHLTFIFLHPICTCSPFSHIPHMHTLSFPHTYTMHNFSPT